jgi:DNA-binding CsgD family transcriptional regulator/PAS domain-containing protein
MLALRASFAIFARVGPELGRQYVENYSPIDPFRAVWLARFCRAEADAIYTGEQIIEPTRLRRTEYFSDFLSAYDIIYHMCAPIAVHNEWAATLSCHRPASKEPFDSGEVNLLRLLFPHLQRAIQFHRRFAELEGHHRASLDALDRLSAGVILLDEHGRIVAANREADRLIRQNDGLSAMGQGIKAARQRETQELHRMIAGAVKTIKSQVAEAGGTLALPRPSGKRPLAVLVAPVGRNAFAPGIGTPAVVVFVTDPERKPESPPSAFRRLYELTAAESRLAELLMQGETFVRAAERLGISHNTARTHLQRIYQKTGSSHQADLVRVLLSAALRS